MGGKKKAWPCGEHRDTENTETEYNQALSVLRASVLSVRRRLPPNGDAGSLFYFRLNSFENIPPDESSFPALRFGAITPMSMSAVSATRFNGSIART